MKTLHCSDAGFDCRGIIKATTAKEVLLQAAHHVKEAHGATITPRLAEQLATLIKDE